jgi:hypothetical protein
MWFAPMITEIVRQGIQDGVLTQPDSDQIGEAVMSLVVGLGDSISRTLLANEPNSSTFQYIQCTVATFTCALERMLGAPSGSLKLMDDELLKEWVVSPP